MHSCKFFTHENCEEMELGHFERPSCEKLVRVGAAPMPGQNSPPSCNDGSSSSRGIQQESGAGEETGIVQLSEIIVREIGGNTWGKGSPHKQTIFRVPEERLCAADKSTYQPTFISFGPYHRGENATEEMRRTEQGKLFALGSIVEGGGGPSVLEFTRAVSSMEADARSCYEGDVQMEHDAFCKMLLLDAVQLMSLLEVLGQRSLQEAASPSCVSATSASPAAAQGCSSIMTRVMMMTIHDLMMLENQIPFFVVEKVYDLRYAGKAIPVATLAWGTIKAIMSDIPPASDSGGVDECKHLVHLCHVYLKPTGIADAVGPRKYGRFRRASEYYEAGVSFRRWNAKDGASPRPLLDVKFDDGVLWMALQSVDEKTVYILRNVLAYEQKYYRTATSAGGSYGAAYVALMSQLLSDPEDVAILSRRGVMQHMLGSDGDVCALFRGLADGLVFDPDTEHYLNPVGVGLQRYCLSSLPRWRAWIVRHRFSNPWLVAAWVFGASAMLCTIIQTVYAVLAYYRS